MNALEEAPLSVVFTRALSSAARAANLPTIQDETQVGYITLSHPYATVYTFIDILDLRSSSNLLYLTYILFGSA